MIAFKQFLERFRIKNSVFVVAAILAATIASIPQQAYAFTDITENDVYYDAIVYIEANGIAGGFSDGEFKPENTITRAEFTKIAVNAEFDTNSVDSCNQSYFPDVSEENVFFEFVCVARENGILNGKSDGNFDPGGEITSAEAMKIISNLYLLTNEADLPPVAERGEDIFKPYVDAMFERAVIPFTLISLDTPLLRDEMAAMIYWLEDDWVLQPEDLLTYEELNIDAADLVDTDFDGTHEGHSDELAPIVTYDIEQGAIVNPEFSTENSGLSEYATDTSKHAAIWSLFIRLIPQERLAPFGNLIIFTDGEEEVLAYVEQNPRSLSKWNLGVDIQDAFPNGSLQSQDLIHTLIHEYAHVLTLNVEQVDVSIFEENCTTYYPGEGCTNGDSYLNQFYNRFWPAELVVENAATGEDPDLLTDFYNKYSGDFVTEYAATNPVEDFAETFTIFVLRDKPVGASGANSKVDFMYEYPELVELREYIRGNI